MRCMNQRIRGREYMFGGESLDVFFSPLVQIVVGLERLAPPSLSPRASLHIANP